MLNKLTTKYSFLFIFCIGTLLAFGQKSKSIFFKAIIIDNKDTVKTGFSFFIIAQNDTIYPNAIGNYNKFITKDSIIDFYLIHKDKICQFKGIETFRLLANK